MNQFVVCFISGASFLLSFLLFFHPLQQNVKANKWLSFFVFIVACAFIGIYQTITETAISHSIIYKCVNSVQFLLAPSFFFSIRYFVNPTKKFEKTDWLHFIPFIIYSFIEIIWTTNKESISTFTLFEIGKNVTIEVRNVLPFIALIYLVQCFIILAKHKKNIQLIASSIHQISLDWLVQFLYILSITFFIWLNDALFGLPYITAATNFIYAISIFFLAYFSMRQKAIFAFKQKDIEQIAKILENDNQEAIITNLIEEETEAKLNPEFVTISEPTKQKPKPKRLSTEQIENLQAQLTLLMEKERLFLDNDLNLPTIAEKLGIGIHEASFLINETTNDNFYNFINKYRVEEAKKLLASTKMEELNILGIAFAAGFNSKTTFNTTFKKIVGVSPSQFSKQQKK